MLFVKQITPSDIRNERCYNVLNNFLLLSALDGGGLKYFALQGTYFVMADYSDVFDGTPIEFTRYLTKEIGVACIPPESFYGREHMHIGRGYVRFAFCKSDDLLRQVKERLVKLGPMSP